MRKTLIASTALVLALATSAGAQDVAVCASPDQSIEVKALYSRNSGLVPGLAARQLDIPDVAIASAMPAVEIAGTSGAGFGEIWASVTEWSNAMTLILKEGHVFEIDGPVPMGKRSERSNYYNLEPDAPFGGHIREDLLSAIYGMELPGRGGSTSRSVHFFDQSGTTAFSVILAGERGTPSEEDVVRFEATMALIKSKGRRIINFSSVGVHLGIKGVAVYVASKAGVEGFTRSFAREMADHNITVNVIAPGPIDTFMTSRVPDKLIDTVVDRQIIQRRGELEDVNQIVSLLLSSNSDMITGEVLKVGGM